MQDQNDRLMSPGGFIIGVQGWVWGEPRARAITFFLDNTVGVYDQYGRAIRGAVVDNKEVLFALTPPKGDGIPGERSEDRKNLGTHAQVIAALASERIDWRKIPYAGWPQIPYDDLAALIKANQLPPTPIEELRKIKDPALRKDALRARREVNESLLKEMAVAEDE